MACWRIWLALGKELNQGCCQMSPSPVPDVGIQAFWCSGSKRRRNVDWGSRYASCLPAGLWSSRFQGLAAWVWCQTWATYTREVAVMERMQLYTVCNLIQLWAEEREYSCIPSSPSKWVFPSKQQMASRVVTLLLWCKSKSGNVR